MKSLLLTWLESNTALEHWNILPIWPSLGPIKVNMYVTPKSGIKTSRAFAAFRYCWVSAVLAERNFVIRTCKKYVWTNIKHWKINLSKIIYHLMVKKLIDYFLSYVRSVIYVNLYTGDSFQLYRKRAFRLSLTKSTIDFSFEVRTRIYSDLHFTGPRLILRFFWWFY